jgi:hypothetical protein
VIDVKNLIKIPYRRNGKSEIEGFDCYTFMVHMREKHFDRKSPIVIEAPTTGIDKESLKPIFGDYITNEPYIQVDKPEDGDIVLLAEKKTEDQKFHHCGIWYKKWVIHCMRKNWGGGVFCHELKLINRLFSEVAFYRES